jgi:citrate lyase subunit beta/citryl-CoA lyase
MTHAPALRSALFVPANRPDFLRKAATTDADAVIIDLEDAVPAAAKDDARRMAGEWIAARPPSVRPYALVRVNHPDLAAVEADLEAVMSPGLLGIVVPKVDSEEQVRAVSEMTAFHEGRAGMERGSCLLWPLIETLGAIRRTFELATASTRVAYMGGGTSERGDLARALHSVRQPDDRETYLLRSRALIEVRAAGVMNPMTGLITRVDGDLDELERFAGESRALGYAGMMVIHPSHIATVNRVFTPAAREVAEARAIIDALASAESGGKGTLRHDGHMIDHAMETWARQVLGTTDAHSDEPAAQ